MLSQTFPWIINPKPVPTGVSLRTLEMGYQPPNPMVIEPKSHCYFAVSTFLAVLHCLCVFGVHQFAFQVASVFLQGELYIALAVIGWCARAYMFVCVDM